MNSSIEMDRAGEKTFHGAATDQVQILRNDVGATSAEYESQQQYLQGARLHLITAWYVLSVVVKLMTKL